MVTYWVYSPGIAGGLLLDDFGTLLPLQELRAHPEDFVSSISADDAGPLRRPLSVGLFAAEYAFLGADTADLKRHSILLHLLNTGCVFWLVLILLRQGGYARPHWPALFAAALWALSPLQVSTVLYLVQRMAMLCAMFVLLSVIAYVKGRVARKPSVAAVWFLVALICAGAAPFAKENGLLVVPLVLLLELFWLSPSALPWRGISSQQRLVGYVIIGGTVTAIGLFIANFDTLTAAYANRNFSLWERLLSQPRALLFYTVGFLFPDTHGLGVYHDDFPMGGELGSGLDVLLILLLSAALAFLLWSVISGRWKHLAFCVAAYLCLHSVESSVLPLEAVFEHRNYLPSVFLVLGIALGATYFRQRFQALALPASAVAILFLLVLTAKTSFLAVVWSNDLMLSIHHSNGHPGSRRAASDLATDYAKLGDYPRAEALSRAAFENSYSHKAARPEVYGDYLMRNAALACLSGLEALPGDFEQLHSAPSKRPLSDPNNLEVMLRMSRSDRCATFDWDGLLAHLHKLYLEVPDPELAPGALYLALAALAYDRGALDDASAYAMLTLSISPDYPLPLFIHLQSLVERGKLVEGAVVRDRLLELDRAGLLTASQRSTLDLYGSL